jgi:hypothetical protein
LKIDVGYQAYKKRHNLADIADVEKRVLADFKFICHEGILEIKNEECKNPTI